MAFIMNKKNGGKIPKLYQEHQCVLTFTTSYFMNSSTYLVAFDGNTTNIKTI